MVSTSEGLVYYCTVFLTAIVFLTEASAITTNYEKSTTSNKTNDSSSQDVTPQRTKLTPTRGRGNHLSKNQNQDRVLTLAKLRANTKPEMVSQDKAERELLFSSNSGGENEVKDKGGGNADDEDQKTLSQQVADGKYGLIQDEIFTVKPERQGIISYDVNPEVPKDNINNLGGLEPDDIWLAENHLLVLAGGGLKEMQTQWRPIDNYVAPSRPVQLSSNPKVPPPFPVQLNENGPIEYLKPDGRPSNSYMPFFNPLLMQYNFSKAYGLQQYGKLPHGIEVPPPLRSSLKPSLPYDRNAPLPPPIYVKPPPSAEFIPPYLGNTNISEADEDDPSLYYPPPYDFYYPKDNTSKVPPGPLVPGIVLPPPPNFFSLMSNHTKSKESKPGDQKPQIKINFKTGKQLHYPFGGDMNKPSILNPSEPSSFITYDDIINEVTYPDTNDDKITYADVKVNKVSTEDMSEEWIPIPAPKPFYITGEKKPIKSALLVMMERPDMPGYNYEKPKNSFKTPKKPSPKYLHFSDTSIEQFSTTTPIAPQLVSTKSSLQNDVYTTTPIPMYQAPPQTIKATYYFYEEPRFVDVEPAKSHFSTSSPLPATSVLEFNDYLPAKEHSNKPALNISNEKKRKPIKPMIPIYYLAELENLVDLVKPMDLPYSTSSPQSPKTEYYTSTVKSTYTINKPSYERPTPKPIFEYNYIASDYNRPADQVSHSTPPPIHYDQQAHYPVDYHPFYDPQPYHQLLNPVAQYNKHVHTTVSPVVYLHNPYPVQNGLTYDTFDRPWIPNINLYNHIQYPTENPYFAFFTKEEADLIDDNTKKYFTIFGQKIKQNAEATTPLSVHTPSPIVNNQWDSKHEYRSFPSQSTSTNNYASFAPTTPANSAIKNPHKKPTVENGYRPPTLEGDTLVNYVTPLPTENVDAEYVTPKISKHIRPIVVEDLPPDVHERLKNIMDLQRQKQKSSASRMRYVLVDHEYDARSQGLINTYVGKYTTEKHRRPEGGPTPISLESDVRVNYQSNLPQNPDAEYIQDVNQPEFKFHDSEEREVRGHNKAQKSRQQKPISLENDILVNYKHKSRYTTTNPDAEYINSGEQANPVKSGSSSSSSNVISYKYPGVEHGHFYFLTPQETRLSHIENERYDFQSDAEKPSSYFKRVPRKLETSTTNSTAKN